MHALQNRSKTVSIANIRALNRLAVLEFLRTRGPISAREIAASLNITRPAAARIVFDLMQQNLVRPAPRPASSIGRKTALVEFNGDAHLAIGVDMGGTKIYAAVANLNGDIHYETYFNHNQCHSEESFNIVCASIEDLIGYAQKTTLPILGISIGVPGATHPGTGLVSHAPSLGWHDFPLKARLSERFPYPLAIENDVNLAVLGELWFGAEPGIENLVLLAIGTGIGAGIIINGNIHPGAHSMAGEVGYLLPDPSCLRSSYPGFGALELLASGTGIASRARYALKESWAEDRLLALTAQDVFSAARMNEPWAVAVLDETVDYLAQAIASLSLVLDPDLILFGGGVSGSADLLIGPIQNRLTGVIPIQTKLAVSRLGYHAGILGGVARLLRDYVEKSSCSESTAAKLDPLKP